MRLRFAGHVEHIRELRNAYRILMGNPENNISVKNRGILWDNNKMDLQGVGCRSVDWLL